MSYSIKDLKDVPVAAAQRLAELGVTSTEQLLDRAGAAATRNKLAGEIGASASQVLTWVNEADLMRVPGVAEGFAQLLEAAGVDTVRELAGRNAESLTRSIAEANERLHLTGRVPSLAQVSAWIEAAKGLAPKVTH